MKKILFLATFLSISLFAVETGDSIKGLKIYKKKVKTVIQLSGSKMASWHSQDEWEKEFSGNGEGFVKELKLKFPKKASYFESKKFKKYLPNLKAFMIEYANDSGNIPSC